MSVKRDWMFCVERKFSHLMPGDEDFAVQTRHSFERGRVNDSVHRIDLAIDLLRGQFEFIDPPFSEGRTAQPEEARLKAGKFIRRKAFQRCNGAPIDEDLLGQ